MINEIVPYALYFIMIIFFVATFNKKNRNDQESSLKVQKNKLKEFLIDSEKKLGALKDLYKQNLITQKIYVEKTDQIAGVVNTVISNDFYEYAKKKNREIIDDLKKEIYGKIESIDISIEKDVNIDLLLDSVDRKLKERAKWKK